MQKSYFFMNAGEKQKDSGFFYSRPLSPKPISSKLIIIFIYISIQGRIGSPPQNMSLNKKYKGQSED
jgi:hypothetical protein